MGHPRGASRARDGRYEVICPSSRQGTPPACAEALSILAHAARGLGFGLLSGDVAFLTTVLVAIDITLAGLFWAMHGDENVPVQLIRKVLYVGFFALCSTTSP